MIGVVIDVETNRLWRLDGFTLGVGHNRVAGLPRYSMIVRTCSRYNHITHHVT